MTKIGAFMVRTKLASEFEFPAPILQGRTSGTENKFINFSLFTTLCKRLLLTLWTNFEDIGLLCKKQKLRVQACDWSKNSAWCVNFENEFFWPITLLHSQLIFSVFYLLDWIETNSRLLGLFFYNKRLSIDHEKPSIIE